MTTPTQETGQPLDFTRPLELVCDGTEVVVTSAYDAGPYHIAVMRADGLAFTPEQHPREEAMFYMAVTKEGLRREGPFRGPTQVVRNRAEANTPVQGDGPLEPVAELVAMLDAFQYGAFDHTPEEFGLHVMENREAIRAALAHQTTTAAEAEPVAWESTTAGYIKHISDRTYHLFSPAVQRWYRPYRCSSCAHPPADKARIAELEAALKPFAQTTVLREGYIVGLERFHFERARAALKDAPHD